jgi:HTH-type transcriptional regulator/antitoxin HigA
MITNERQYKISRRKLAELRQAITDFDTKAIAEQTGSDILVAAELEALKSEEQLLASQVGEYERLRSGKIERFTASSLDELPRLLIRARIAQGLSQRALAELIGVKEQQIQRYESSDYAGASLQRLRQIADALGLSIIETAELARPVGAVPRKSRELEWSRFPVKEMYKRGWFEGFSGSLDVALQQADTLVQEFIGSVIKRPATALYRRRVRSGLSLDEYALMAWECRILSLAKKAQLSGARPEQSLNSEWIADLARQSGESDGPLRAKAMLEEAGIALIVEPHLAHTYLDGAALLHAGAPVIGMTLRYDRLDNFWFVLFHELFHVIKHLRKGKLHSIFDDLEVTSEDKIEQEADVLAREALIPSTAWDHALVRYVQSEESIKAFAAELGISPAIVAGRIRHEANNYVILNELVGQGEVRRHFQESDSVA